MGIGHISPRNRKGAYTSKAGISRDKRSPQLQGTQPSYELSCLGTPGLVLSVAEVTPCLSETGASLCPSLARSEVSNNSDDSPLRYGIQEGWTERNAECYIY